MENHFEEIKVVSWFQRFKRAIAGIIFAPLFIFVGFVALKFGEIEHANTTNALKNIQPKIKEESTAANNDLLYKTDVVKAAGDLTDEEFGFKLKSVKLLRRVYTWQWIEIIKTKKERTFWGGKKTTTTYDYIQGWSRQHFDHRTFKYPAGHENIDTVKYDSLLLNHRTAAFGKYQLDTSLLKTHNRYRLASLSSEMFAKLKPAVIGKDSTECLSMDFFSGGNCGGYFSAQADNNGGSYYGGNTSANTDGSGGAYNSESIPSDFLFIGNGKTNAPKLGDCKIVYWYVPEEEYTIVGEKVGNTIRAYRKDHMFITSEVSCGGFKHASSGYFGIIMPGKQTVEAMFEKVHNQNNMLFIFLRLAGVLFMFAGFLIFAHPLILLFGWLPFVGKVWEKLIFKILQVLSFIVSLSISGYYWMKYNNASNLSIWDLYFGLIIIVLLIFCNSLSAEVRSGGKTIYSEDF